VVHGLDLSDMSSAHIDDILQSYDDVVFCRTTPLQTAVIAQACDRHGSVLAVTDGSLYESLMSNKDTDETDTDAHDRYNCCCFMFL